MADLSSLVISGGRSKQITSADTLVVGLGIKSTGALAVTPGAGTNLNVVLSTTGDFAVNTNQFYVDTSASNVGIGTVTPGAKLQVNADASGIGQIIRANATTPDDLLRLQNSAGTALASANKDGKFLAASISAGGVATTADIGFINDTDTGLYWRTANVFGVMTGGSHRAFFGSDGSLLINGTDQIFSSTAVNGIAPKLHVDSSPISVTNTVAGTDGDYDMLRLRANELAGTRANIRFLGNSNVKLASIVAITKTNGVAGHLAFETSESADTLAERMRVDSNGNVGINKTVPTEKLDVVGNIGLPTTTSTVGQILINSTRFLHSFGTADNAFVGRNAGNLTNTGSGNVGIGSTTLFGLTTGSANTAVGNGALQEITAASSNTAIGSSALGAATILGNLNIAIGQNAMGGASIGSSNIGIGADGALVQGSGNDNTVVGTSAAKGTGGFSRLSAFGKSAAAVQTTGTDNTFIGYSSGSTSTTNTSVTLLGANTSVATATGISNATAIGADAVASTSNVMQFGSTSVTLVQTSGGIRTGSYLEVIERTAPSTPSDGYGRIYAKSDNKLYFLNDAGTETDLTAGAATSLATGNRSMTASVTTTDNDQATTTTVAAVVQGEFSLFLNGQKVSVGDGTKTGVAAYVSGDAGVTARAFSAIVAGDTIRWNGSVYGSELAATDKLDALYLTAGAAGQPVTVGGTIAVNQVAFGSGTNTVQGSAALAFDGATLTVNNGASAVSPLIVKDNGTAVLTVADGGGITATSLATTGAVISTGGLLSSVAPGTSGNVLTSNGTTWTSTAASSGGLPASTFGDGSDGALTVSSGTTTFTRDMFYTTVTPTGTAVINTAGFALYVSVLLDLTNAPAGAISFNGGAGGTGASGGAGGAATTGTTVGNSAVGGAGGGNSAAVVGGSVTNSLGGAGGKGGDQDFASRIGAAAGTVSSPANKPRYPVTGGLRAPDATLLKAGAGGGGGESGGSTDSSGGGGGGGGGFIRICANEISRGASTATGAISCVGGNGGLGETFASGAGGGGGGGGGGGCAHILAGSLSGTEKSGAITAAGGTGGTGGDGNANGRGGDGGNGGNGGSVFLITSTSVTVTNGSAGSTGTDSSDGDSLGGAGGAGGACSAAL